MRTSKDSTPKQLAAAEFQTILLISSLLALHQKLRVVTAIMESLAFCLSADEESNRNQLWPRAISPRARPADQQDILATLELLAQQQLQDQRLVRL